jgi:hypothetical protein
MAAENGAGDGALTGAVTRALTVAADLGEVLASFDDFLAGAADDRPIVPVPVPEWGGRVVLMRAMSSRDRDEWTIRLMRDEPFDFDDATRRAREQRLTYADRMLGANALLVGRTIVGPDGARIFTDAQVGFLEARNAAVINRLADKALELNGFTQRDVEQLEAARAAGKDGSASPSDAPSSGSPGS